MKKTVFILITLMASSFICDAWGKESHIDFNIDRTKVEPISKDSVQRVIDKAQRGDADAQNLVGLWYYTGQNMGQDYAKAYQMWKAAALQEHVLAIGNLGLCFQYGRGTERDSMDAMRLYMKSIKSGNAKLLEERRKGSEQYAFDAILVAQCYQRGCGVEKDPKKATEYFEKGARLQSSDAQRELALILLNSKEPAKAAPWFKRAADKGDLSSTYYYGKLLLDGKGVKQDKQGAVIYLLKAAEAGFAQAQAVMGDLYSTGTGVPRNEETSAQWYLRAAGNGNVHAMWSIATNYLQGKGVAQNYDAALFWFAESYASGLQQKFKKMLGDDSSVKNSAFPSYIAGMKAYIIEKDLDRAMNEFKKVEKGKVIDGKVMQAVIMANKDYAKHNAKKAAKMLRKTEKEHPAGAFFLATLYEYGKGVEKDMQQAITLYRHSANAGYGAAQSYLGDIYYEGRGVPQDYTKAVEYYTKAYYQRRLSKNATRRLASCYENGWGGLPTDKKKASQLLKEERKDNVTMLLSEYMKAR